MSINQDLMTDWLGFLPEAELWLERVKKHSRGLHPKPTSFNYTRSEMIEPPVSPTRGFRRSPWKRIAMAPEVQWGWKRTKQSCKGEVVMDINNWTGNETWERKDRSEAAQRDIYTAYILKSRKSTQTEQIVSGWWRLTPPLRLKSTPLTVRTTVLCDGMPLESDAFWVNFFLIHIEAPLMRRM